MRSDRERRVNHLFYLLALLASLAILMPILGLYGIPTALRAPMAAAASPGLVAMPSGSMDSTAESQAGRIVIDSIAAEVRLKRAELEGVGLALGAVRSVAQLANQTRMELQATTARLSTATRDIERLRLEVAALREPWRGHADEKLCSRGHRCANYIDAGKTNLTALSSVAMCSDYCGRAFKHIGFFAYHNEHGMLAFMLDPKGRCRCYDSTPCEMVPDGGYNLWSASGMCSPDLVALDQAEVDPSKPSEEDKAAAAAVALPLADPKAGA
jgi:hypothetical protein